MFACLRYNFAPRVTHKTFDAEEAEELFAARGKILNQYALKVLKQLKPGREDDDDDEDLDGEGKKKKKGQKGKGDLKVSGEQRHKLKYGKYRPVTIIVALREQRARPDTFAWKSRNFSTHIPQLTFSSVKTYCPSLCHSTHS